MARAPPPTPNTSRREGPSETEPEKAAKFEPVLNSDGGLHSLLAKSLGCLTNVYRT